MSISGLGGDTENNIVHCLESTVLNSGIPEVTIYWKYMDPETWDYTLNTTTPPMCRRVWKKHQAYMTYLL